MPFKKGQSGNPKGKPAGTKSQKVKAWELLADKITNEHTEKVNDYLDKLHRKDPDLFFQAYLKLLEYFKPKYSRSEITTPPDEPFVVQYDYGKLSTKTLKELRDAAITAEHTED